MTVRWISELRDDGAVVFRVGRVGEELVAEWPGRLLLRCDPRGERPLFERQQGADAEAAERLERGLGRALVEQLRGVPSLHASVVAKAGRAIACVGQSGAGKSTSAALLCRMGYRLLRDDIAPLGIDAEAVTVTPADDRHSLADDVVEALQLRPLALQVDGKHYVAAPAGTGSSRLVAIVALVTDEAATRVTRRRLRGMEAVAALVPCVVRFVVDDPARSAAELRMLSELCAKVPLHELRRPAALPTTTAGASGLEACAHELACIDGESVHADP